MPAPLTAAEMASLKARSTSQSLSVDQKGHSRPGSTSSLGTVNITIQPPVGDLSMIAALRLMCGMMRAVATSVQQLCNHGVRHATISAQSSRRGPASSASSTYAGGRWHDSDGFT